MPINPMMFGVDQQQQGNNQQSGINWGLLSPQVAPKEGVVASSGGGGGDGIGSLLSGLSGLVKGLGGMMPRGGNDGQSPNTGVNPGYNPQSPAQAAQNALTPAGMASTDSLFQNANQMMGKNEHDPIMKEYLQKANPGLDPAVTPWCAGFVGSVLNASGMKGTGSLAARSYLKYGTPTDKPTNGDIVVLSRGNDPTLGHVGFYAGTDQNGNVKVLGGNHNDQVGVGSYPASQVLGFRVPPSGQQVAKIAQQNNIQNPNQLANITKGSQVDNQQPNQNPAVNVIKQFEGYDHTAKWDVNAFRAGYGSDTITRPDGTIQKVKQGMTVSPEDAERDLTRRTQEFQNTATKQVGDNIWGQLPQGAQVALTSVAYNYGSLPKSVVKAAQTGSPSVLAGAIRALGGDNKGVNRQRRNQEANMIVNGVLGPQTMNTRSGINGNNGPHFNEQGGSWSLPGSGQVTPQINPNNNSRMPIQSDEVPFQNSIRSNALDGANFPSMAMNTRNLPGTQQSNTRIRDMHPEDIDAIMKSQGAPTPTYPIG